MIDFHTHILPGIDDGSSHTEESVGLLKCLAKQGVTGVAATPHFYPAHRSISEFLEYRQMSYEHLRERLTETMPELRLGAEILYFSGVSRLQELKALCLQGSGLLLLEMPVGTWSDYMVREIIDLSCSGEWTVLMAHIERYLPMQKAAVWDALLEHGILMQSNADFFTSFRMRRKAVRLLQEGRIHLLGTDCHNMTSRPPQMAQALETIRKYGGEDCLQNLIERSRLYFDDPIRTVKHI